MKARGSQSVTIQNEATEKCFPVVLFVSQYSEKLHLSQSSFCFVFG